MKSSISHNHAAQNYSLIQVPKLFKQKMNESTRVGTFLATETINHFGNHHVISRVVFLLSFRYFTCKLLAFQFSHSHFRGTATCVCMYLTSWHNFIYFIISCDWRASSHGFCYCCYMSSTELFEFSCQNVTFGVTRQWHRPALLTTTTSRWWCWDFVLSSSAPPPPYDSLRF